MSVDATVHNVRAVVPLLVAAVGFPDGQEFHRREGVEWEVSRMVVNSNRAYGVTCLQLLSRTPMAPSDLALALPVNDYIVAFQQSQPHFRPMRTHATILVTHRLDELPSFLEGRGVPYRVTPEKGYVWIGMSADPASYDPAYDGGLCLEFVAPWTEPVIEQETNPTVPPGTMVRITARTHLVENLDDVITRLRQTLGWPGPSEVEFQQCPGYRVAILRPTEPTSAVLELIEPTSSRGRFGDALAQYGPGLFSGRIGVRGLRTKLQDLDDRGTSWNWVDPGSGVERVELDRRAVGGLMLELEELVA